MATKHSVISAADRLGATVEDDGWGMITVDAPAKHRWSVTGTHAVSTSYNYGDKSEAWDDLLVDIESGIEACPPGGDENCYAYDCPALKTGAEVAS